MIHEPLKNILAQTLTGLDWSVNFYAKNDNTGTVYAHPGEPSNYEGNLFRPGYQVLIRSSDWDKAETYAYQTQKLLHRRKNEVLTTYLYENDAPVKRLTVELMFMVNVGGIHNLGVTEDNVREYSINFDTLLNLIQEEDL